MGFLSGPLSLARVQSRPRREDCLEAVVGRLKGVEVGGRGGLQEEAAGRALSSGRERSTLGKDWAHGECGRALSIAGTAEDQVHGFGGGRLRELVVV